MFFLSREGRQLFSNCGMFEKGNELAYRIAADQCALRFPITTLLDFQKPNSSISSENIIEFSVLPAKLVDAPKFNLRDYIPHYRYLTEDFVVTDYSRLELLKLASIIFRYDVKVIKRLGDSIKQRQKFSIPYLLAVLESDGAAALEEIRHENRMEELVRETHPLILPDIRPTNITERLEKLREERRFDDALRGKNG